MLVRIITAAWLCWLWHHLGAVPDPAPRLRLSRQNVFIEFPVSQIPTLQDYPVEIGISSAVIELRAGERCIRELALDLTTPKQFDLLNEI